MAKKLNANGKYILVEVAEPEVEGIKSSLLLSPADLNPSLLYCKVLSTGDECLTLYDGDFVYVNKMNAIKLNHLNKDYYIIHENDIFVYFSDEAWKEALND